MTDPEPLQQVDRTFVRWRGRKLSYFSGCDYFRLSSHPQVQRALTSGLKEFGLNVAASRLTTGNHVLYGTLEQALARFFKTEAALLVPGGYVSNLVVAQALAGRFSHVLLDEAAHPSLVDAAAIFDCPVLKFAHASLSELEATVDRCGAGCRPILLTDGMFARDGSVAPLKEYLKMLPADAQVLVDDAHGAGVLGANGRGAPEHSGIGARQVIQTVTLSKAFGVYGGAVLGSAKLRSSILERSRLFVGSTPLPLPLVNAALQALTILESDPELRSRLHRNAALIKDAAKAAGIAIPETPGPIVALAPKEPQSARKISEDLLRSGIYPPLIIYPGGPGGGYFRFVLSSEHAVPQLKNLAGAVAGLAERVQPL